MEIKKDDRPTMPKLLKFPGKKDIDIPQQIGGKYMKFGTFLLNDETQVRVRAIEKMYNNDAEEINMKLLEEWVRGSGKQPVTWETLVQVLEDAGLTELAKEINSVLASRSTPDSSPVPEATSPNAPGASQSQKVDSTVLGERVALKSDKIIHVLSANVSPDGLAHALLVAGLINDDIKAEAQVKFVAIPKRIRPMIDAVATKIELNAANYDKFITVLRQYKLDDLIKFIES